MCHTLRFLFKTLCLEIMLGYCCDTFIYRCIFKKEINLLFLNVFKKTLKIPLDCKEIQTVNPIGNQSWIFIERTDAEAEASILWPPDAKNWLIRKDPDAGKDWGQEEKVGNRGYGWKASPTQWTWVWVSSGSWWWTGKSGMLQSMESQRVRHDWVT